MLADGIHPSHLPAQRLDLLAQPLGLGFDFRRRGAVGGLQSIQIALDALLDLLLAPVNLVRREVAVAAVDRLELAAVDGHDRLGKQLQLPAQLHEAATHRADAGAVGAAEVGDGLEVGCQPPGEPHQLHVALRFALEPTARGDAVQVTVDVELEQHRRVIRGAAGLGRLGTGEAECRQIELFDEGIDRAHRIVLGDVVIQARRQQGRLAAVFPFDEALHPALASKRVAVLYERSERFHTPSARSGRNRLPLDWPQSGQTPPFVDLPIS